MHPKTSENFPPATVQGVPAEVETFSVLRNVYDENGNIKPDEKWLDSGWRIEGSAEGIDGQHTVIVAKVIGERILQKTVSYESLVEAQVHASTVENALASTQSSVEQTSSRRALRREAKHRDSRKGQLIQFLKDKIQSKDMWSEQDGLQAIARMVEVSWRDGIATESQQDITEIALSGTLGGVEITPVYGKSNVGDPFRKVAQLLGIYNQDPETAKALVENRIAGFHATQSSALYGIVTHKAILSAQTARSRGTVLSSGEKLFSSVEGQQSISFGDWRAPETIAQYAESGMQYNSVEGIERRVQELQTLEAEMGHLDQDGRMRTNIRQSIQDLRETALLIQKNPKSVQSRMLLANFPVALGVNVDDIPAVDLIVEHNKARNEIVQRVPGDIVGEFMYFGPEMPLDRVRVIAVPKEKIKETKIFLATHGVDHIQVVDISPLTRNHTTDAIRRDRTA